MRKNSICKWCNTLFFYDGIPEPKYCFSCSVAKRVGPSDPYSQQQPKVGQSRVDDDGKKHTRYTVSESEVQA